MKLKYIIQKLNRETGTWVNLHEEEGLFDTPMDANERVFIMDRKNFWTDYKVIQCSIGKG